MWVDIKLQQNVMKVYWSYWTSGRK